MAVIKCPACGKYISSNLEKCPECGAEINSEEPQQTSAPARQHRISPRRICAIILGVLAACFIIFVIYKDHQRAVGLEQRAYERLEGCTDLNWYEDYMVRYPDGEHIEEVKRLYEKARHEQEEFYLQAAGGTREQLLAFIKTHPSSPYCKVCESRIDSLDWKTATTANTAVAYNQYLMLHPNGIFAETASDKRLTLQRQEVTPDERSMLNGALANFLAAMTSGDAARVEGLIEQPLTFCGQSNASSEDILNFYTTHFHRDDILGVHFSTRGGLNVRKQPVAGSDNEFAYSVTAQLDATLNRTSTDSLSNETWNLTAQITPERRFSTVTLSRR